jgi:hypothetical protein
VGTEGACTVACEVRWDNERRAKAVCCDDIAVWERRPLSAGLLLSYTDILVAYALLNKRPCC